MHPKQNERAICKTKALMSKRKPQQSFCYAPTEGSGCIFFMCFFRGFLSRRCRRRNYAGIIHIPGCICRLALGFCKNIKKRTETLYQSFSPFMVRETGLEPASSYEHMNLNHARLPIPPFPHGTFISYTRRRFLSRGNLRFFKISC